jgi:hypothetical protein
MLIPLGSTAPPGAADTELMVRPFEFEEVEDAK